MSRSKSSSGPLYAITVAFELQEGAHERFLELIKANAAASVSEEPGCYRFDVLTPRASGNGSATVLLYEIYADRAAFDAHAKSPHFLAFDAASRNLVRSKRVTEFDAYENCKP